MSAGVEKFAKLVASPADAGSNRADRDSERCGDLAVCQTLDREQDEGVAVGRGQVSNRRCESSRHHLGIDSLNGALKGIFARLDTGRGRRAL